MADNVTIKSEVEYSYLASGITNKTTPISVTHALETSRESEKETIVVGAGQTYTLDLSTKGYTATNYFIAYCETVGVPFHLAFNTQTEVVPVVAPQGQSAMFFSTVQAGVIKITNPDAVSPITMVLAYGQTL
jgi:hypothetical protein